MDTHLCTIWIKQGNAEGRLAKSLQFGINVHVEIFTFDGGFFAGPYYAQPRSIVEHQTPKLEKHGTDFINKVWRETTSERTI